jgi:hypothetical protein
VVVCEYRWPEPRLLQEVQGRLDDGMLASWVARCVKRIAVAKRHAECARGTDAFGHPAQELNGDGGDATTLQLGGDQAHGLVTKRSNGHQ